MYEFEVGEARYRANKLNVFDQWEIAQALVPVLTALAPGPDQMRLLGEAIASIKREKFESVVTISLVGLERFQAQHNTWVKVWNQMAKRSQFDDLNDLAGLLPVISHVVQENLANFFKGPLTNLTTLAGPQT